MHEFWGEDTIQPTTELREHMTMKERMRTGVLSSNMTI